MNNKIPDNKKISINNKVKNVFRLISKNEFQSASNIIDSLKYLDMDKITWIDRYIKEIQHYYIIKNTDEGKLIYKYIELGSKYLNQEDYKKALESFNEGLNITNDPLFKYYIGVCYYHIKEYKKSINELRDYNSTSVLKQKDSYLYLSKAYTKLGELAVKENERAKDTYNKGASCYSEYKKLENIEKGIVFDIQKSVNLTLNDSEVSELIIRGKINDVVDLFNTATYKRKITILALLYKNGNQAIADKLLKKNKDDLEENCKDELKQLNKNKQLYLKQSKFKR